jgi:hypothetical protein
MVEVAYLAIFDDAVFHDPIPNRPLWQPDVIQGVGRFVIKLDLDDLDRRIHRQVDDQMQVAGEIKRKRAGKANRRLAEYSELERVGILQRKTGLGPANMHNRRVGIESFKMFDDIGHRELFLGHEYWIKADSIRVSAQKWLNNDLFNLVAWLRDDVGWKNFSAGADVLFVGENNQLDGVELHRNLFFVEQFILGEQRNGHTCQQGK